MKMPLYCALCGSPPEIAITCTDPRAFALDLLPKHRLSGLALLSLESFVASSRNIIKDHILGILMFQFLLRNPDIWLGIFQHLLPPQVKLKQKQLPREIKDLNPSDRSLGYWGLFENQGSMI